MKNYKTIAQSTNDGLNEIIEIAENFPQSNKWEGETTITPGTAPVQIPALLDKALTVDGDADLLPQNIRNGVNLFGITGNMKDFDTGIVKLSTSEKLSNVRFPTSKKRSKLAIQLTEIEDILHYSIWTTNFSTISMGRVSSPVSSAVDLTVIFYGNYFSIKDESKYVDPGVNIEYIAW